MARVGTRALPVLTAKTKDPHPVSSASPQRPNGLCPTS
jgi:hypothetical protein